jgi:hypothetical protein
MFTMGIAALVWGVHGLAGIDRRTGQVYKGITLNLLVLVVSCISNDLILTACSADWLF